jgi:hypothetical protein
MTCPSCLQRKAKRACPALGYQICPTCCGTKRLKEIACVPDCRYLASARAHPAAVVQRQRERDATIVMGMLGQLSEPQMSFLSRLTLHLQAYRRTAIPALVDADVRDAVSAMASTLETTARGIFYEHRAPSLPAQRLVTHLDPVREEAESRGRLRPAAIADVLRRVETAARQADDIAGGGETAFLDFLDRSVTRTPPPEPAGAGGDDETRDPRRIILP